MSEVSIALRGMAAVQAAEVLEAEVVRLQALNADLLEALQEEMEWLKRLPIPTQGATRRLLALSEVVRKATGQTP